MKLTKFLCPALVGLMLTSHLPADNIADGQAAELGQADRNKSQGARNDHPDAQWFPQAGLGLFIHWGIASVKPVGDLSWGMLANKPWEDLTSTTPNLYYAAIKDWKPDHMDYDSMLAAAKAAGATYAVMVTKHHDGFTLWPSAHGDLGTKSSLGSRDFVKEFTDACRKHGLKVGLYYSPIDWWFDRKYKTFSMKGPALDMDHKPVKLPPAPKDHESKRRELVRGHLTELLTHYGKIDLLWFDGGKREMENDEIRKISPGIVINGRNGGKGDYNDSEGSLPASRFKGWFETCSTCWPSRKWSYIETYGFDNAPMTLAKLVLLRAWGGNLLANVGPKGDGSVPEQALSCWKDMAGWMKHSRESVIGTQHGPWPKDANLPITTTKDAAYIHFLPKFPQEAKKILRSLPTYTDECVWKTSRQPAKAILLRTGSEVPFRYASHTLRLKLLPELRTQNVDVVKIFWGNDEP